MLRTTALTSSFLCSVRLCGSCIHAVPLQSSPPGQPVLHKAKPYLCCSDADLCTEHREPATHSRAHHTPITLAFPQLASISALFLFLNYRTNIYFVPVFISISTPNTPFRIHSTGCMSAEMEDQEYPEIIDLTEDTDDDVDIPSSETVAANNQENQLHHLPAESARLTEQECQERIVNLFPDIDRAHVLKLVSQSEGSDGRSVEWCERLIGTILDAGPYPKEREKANNQKRKRHDEDDDDLISKYIDSSRAYDRPSMEIA